MHPSKARSSDPVIRPGSIMATPERANKAGGVIEELIPEDINSRVMIARCRAKCECWLDVYFLSGKISKDEHAAGMRFRAAWLTKAEGIKTKDSTIPSIGCGEFMDAVDRMTYAERVLKESFAELSHNQALIVVSVCGANEAAGDKSRLMTLHRGLDCLSRFWGLV